MDVGETEVREFLARYEAASNSHDFVLVAPLIAPNAYYRFNDGDFEGREAIGAAFVRTWTANDVTGERYWLTGIRVVNTGDRSATVSYDFHWAGKAGERAFEVAGRGTNVLVRGPGGLQSVYEHLSR